MFLKCTNDHEIAKGQKFCGECGQGPKAEAEGKCGKCEGSILKAHNFCPGCGEKAGAVNADADLTVALDGLTAFAKAHIAIAKDMATLPAVDAKAVEQKDVDVILKAAVERTNAKGDQTGVDAEAAITEILKSHNLLAAKLDTYAGHHQTGLAHVAEGNSVLMKAFVALAGMNRELSEQVAALTAKVDEKLAEPRGRKGAQVLAIAKGGPASAAGTGKDATPAGGDELQLEEGELMPSDVIAKCLMATQHDDSILSTHDFAKVTTMANGMGLTLKAMCQLDEALAPNILGAVAMADRLAAQRAAQ